MLQLLLIALVTCCALSECVAEDGVLDPLQIVDDPTAIHRTRRLIFGGMFSDKSNSFKYEKVKKTVGGKLTILGIPIGISVTYGTGDGNKPQHGRKIENVKQVTKIENKSAGAKGKFLGVGIGAEFNMQVSKKETKGDLTPPNSVVLLPPTAVKPAQGPVGSGAGTREVSGPPTGKAISAIQPVINSSPLGTRSYPFTYYERKQNPDIKFSLPFTLRKEFSENVDSKDNDNPNFSLPFTSMKKFSRTQNSLNINVKDPTYTLTRIKSEAGTKKSLKPKGNGSSREETQDDLALSNPVMIPTPIGVNPALLNNDPSSQSQSRRKRSYNLKYKVLHSRSLPSEIPNEVPYYQMIPSFLDHPIHLTRLWEEPLNIRVIWNPTLREQNEFSNLESNLQKKTFSILQDIHDKLQNPWPSQKEVSPRRRPVWFNDFRPALQNTLASVQEEIAKKKQNNTFDNINIISTFNEGGETVPYFTTLSW